MMPVTSTGDTPAAPPQAIRRPGRRLARLLLVITGAEIAVAGILYIRGFPYFGSGLVPNAPWWEVPVALLHLPAIEILTAAGLCCGFRNGLVLSHVVRGGHVPMTLTGTGILAATNLACWAVLGAGSAWIWSRRRRALVSRSGAGGHDIPPE
jgi:hypothetical protein